MSDFGSNRRARQRILMPYSNVSPEMSRLARRVPLTGNKKFMGTDSGLMATKSKSISTTSSLDSPMPMIPPQHISKPMLCNMRMFWMRRSYVWVLQISG